jgi:hypothetical protein
MTACMLVHSCLTAAAPCPPVIAGGYSRRHAHDAALYVCRVPLPAAASLLCRTITATAHSCMAACPAPRRASAPLSSVLRQ